MFWMRALCPSPKMARRQRIDSFSAAEEVLNDPGLKSVFKTALDNGFAVVLNETDKPNQE
jgi:hypothetical protein